MVPRVGQHIGPYEILGRLGSGGMGLVFSAWDARLQRDVAIKMLREEFATPSMRSRFLQEARAASRLNHANICTIFDIGEVEGDPYLVMELLKGETLRARIGRGNISTEDLQVAATEIADALIVAHGKGIIHRDIKPANIILVEKEDDRFQTKVLDFGLAKIDDSMESTRFDLTSAGTTVGTVAYMSPEQARGEPLDARSDLFSLGVVLYEMATGELPFQGATSALVFVQLLNHRPEPVREYNPDVPKDLEKIIMTLLEKKRSDRFQKASEVVQALRKVQIKQAGAGKSMWGQRPTRGWKKAEGSPQIQPEPSKPKQDTSKWGILGQGAGSSASGQVAARGSGATESFIRPVKRVVDSSFPTPKPESSPPAGSTVRPLPPVSAGPGSVPPSSRPADLSPVPSAPPSPLPGAPASSAPAGSSAAARSVAVNAAANAASVFDSGMDRTRPISGSGVAPRVVRPQPSGRFKGPDLGDDDDFRRSSSRKVATSTEEVVEAKSGVGKWIAAGVAVAVLGGGFVWYSSTHHAPPPSDVPTSVLLASMTNRTGDNTLSGLLNAGLLFDLKQSPHLTIRGMGDLNAGMTLMGAQPTTDPTMEDARKAAKAVGIANLAFGDVHMDNGSYVVSVRIYDVASGARVTEANEVTTSREQVGDAVDRVALDLRSGMGESGDSIGRYSVPLNREATSNLDALQAFTTANGLRRSGQIVDAMFAFERAVGMDPKFTQAYIELADIYRMQNAETAAAAAATKAQDNSAPTGSRTQALAQVSYAVNTLGDYSQAVTVLQQLATTYPADVQAHEQLSMVYRLMGRYADALTEAEKTLKLTPASEKGRVDAELALIAVDRADAAAALEQQARRAGQVHGGIDLLIALVSATGAPTIDVSGVSDQLTPREYAASVLDAGGQFNAGLALWRDVANHAKGATELGSAASYALSQAAMDRALASDCSSAGNLAREAITLPQGPQAEFATGMASALCMNVDLARKSQSALAAGAQGFAAKNLYEPVLDAAIQWKTGDTAGALTTLQAAKAFDAISLAPYLRGLIHMGANQPTVALGDFQVVLGHRGATTLMNPEVYALSELGVARAYTASGDAVNASRSYSTFVGLWTNADPGGPNLPEAQAHAH